MYFIGLYKLELGILGDFLVVKVGKKEWERFANYIKANYDKFINRLVLLSIKNDCMQLDDLVSNLVTSKEI